jgi:hypothetical protein
VTKERKKDTMANTNEINFSSVFSNIAEKLQKPEKVKSEKVKKEKLITFKGKDEKNDYAFSFAGSYHPKAGKSFMNIASLRDEEPTSGLDLLQDVGLDNENFKVHVVKRHMPDIFNPGQYLETEGSQVVATWNQKQFEMNPSVSEGWADFTWEDSLLPPEEMENALIPWGITAFDNGKRVAVQYLVGDIGEGGIKEGVAYLLTLMGSLDGSLALMGKQTMTRIVCANTFAHVQLQQNGGLGKLRRHAQANTKLGLWKNSYAEIVTESKEYQKKFEKMMQRKIQPSEQKQFFTALFGKNIEDATERNQQQLLNIETQFVQHLTEQPGSEELEHGTVWQWTQGLSSWNIREKRVNLRGNIGNVNEEVVRTRSRFDQILTSDTYSQPAMNYLYQLVA